MSALTEALLKYGLGPSQLLTSGAMGGSLGAGIDYATGGGQGMPPASPYGDLGGASAAQAPMAAGMPANVPLPPPRPSGLNPVDVQTPSVPMPPPRPPELSQPQEAPAAPAAAPQSSGGPTDFLSSLFGGGGSSGGSTSPLSGLFGGGSPPSGSTIWGAMQTPGASQSTAPVGSNPATPPANPGPGVTSFMDKILGPAGQSQSPLVRKDSLIGRLAGLMR